MTTYYHTVNGKLIGETTDGVRTDYLTDALGNITGTIDQTGAVINTYRYKPFGSRLAKTGVGPDPRFQWVGESGSRVTGLQHAEQYNRRRHYGTKLGQWTSVDLLWPEQKAYSYGYAAPVSVVDPTGMMPQVGDCSGLTKRASDDMMGTMDKLCRAILNRSRMIRIRKCASQQGINVTDLEACLKRFCAGEGRVNCGGSGCGDNWSDYTCLAKIPECFRGCETDQFQLPGACASTACNGKGNPSQQITICSLLYGDYVTRRCDCPGHPPELPCRDIKRTIIHEILHVCGQCEGLDNEAHQGPFARAAECIKRELGIR